MTQPTVGNPIKRRYRRPGIDRNGSLEMLFKSITEILVLDPLSENQSQVVHDHLRYALVTGYESTLTKPRIS